MHSTTTVVQEHAKMSVKNDASGSVEQISIFTNMPKSIQSCNG